MVIHVKKRQELENTLYKGLVKAYNEKRIINGKRVPITSLLGKQILQDCKGLCAIDEAEFLKEPHGFEIHHKDGNRTNNDPKNLILLCGKCHKSITGTVNLKFNDYRKKHPIKYTKIISKKSKITSKNKIEKDIYSEQEKQIREWEKNLNKALQNMGMH
jgi:hypothetical protein